MAAKAQTNLYLEDNELLQTPQVAKSPGLAETQGAATQSWLSKWEWRVLALVFCWLMASVFMKLSLQSDIHQLEASIEDTAAEILTLKHDSQDLEYLISENYSYQRMMQVVEKEQLTINQEQLKDLSHE